MKRGCVPVLVVAAVTLGVRSASAQARAHEQVDVAGTFLPTSVASVEDRDGDGLRDLLVGGYLGLVRIVSSADGAVLLDLSVPGFDEQYGFSVASAGDVDADGAEDYLVGIPRAWHQGVRTGGARIVSGATGGTIRYVHGQSPDTMFGARVRDAGDVDGDGFSDSIVGSEDFGSGLLRRSSVFSGATGAELHGYAALGVRVCFEPAGDVDGDGRDDLLRPEIEVSMPNGSTGKVSLISGADGHVLRTFRGAPGELNFGFLCAGAGDLDQDGVPDLLCGPRADATLAGNYAAIRSGATGSEVRRMSLTAAGLPLGAARALALEDADGDGVVDYLLASHVGQTLILSGLDGSALFQLPTDFQPATCVASAGDLNLDGRTDVLLAGPVLQTSGVHAWMSYLSDCPKAQKFCTPPQAPGCTPYAFFVGGSSLTVGDPLELRALGAPTGSIGFLIWNTTHFAAPFHGERLCVSPKNAHVESTGPAQIYPGFPCWDSFSFVMDRSYLVQHGLLAGDTIQAQFATPAGGTGWLSEAIRFTVCP